MKESTTMWCLQSTLKIKGQSDIIVILILEKEREIKEQKKI